MQGIGKIFTHIIGWLIFLSLPLLFISGQNADTGIEEIVLSPFYWLFLFCYAFLFYTHTYFVFPAWYTRKKYFLYAGYLIVLFALIMLISPFDKLVGFDGPRPGPEHFPDRFPFPPGGMRPPHHRGARIDIVSIILYCLTLALSIAVITLRQLRKTEQRALQADAQKAKAELSYLKAQINPHFLFNTLNNIYVLATSHQENTAEAIMKLSNILRYVTEEISDDFVSLGKEAACIRDYIDLQQLRLSKTTVEFSTEGDFQSFNIPPMVLMTYIENAFKFGVSSREASTIKIEITAKNNVINFYCSNALFETGNKERTGIGLVNTRQHLDHLYQGKYELAAGISGNQYLVRLSIRN